MNDEIIDTKTEKEGLHQAIDRFANLYEIKDPLQREYELVQAAKQFDVPLETFRQMFQVYCEAKLETEAMPLVMRTKKFASSLIQTIEYIGQLSAISLLIGVVTYIAETPQRAEQMKMEQKQMHYQAWEIINNNQGKQSSGGRIDALQDLNKDGVSLAGLDAEGAVLLGINLKGADLRKARLSGAKIMNADLSGADLTAANFRGSDTLLLGTNLSQAIVKDADLSQANLSNVNLTGAWLSNSELNRANLRNANLTGAELRGCNLFAVNLMGANLQNTKIDDDSLEGSLYDRKTVFPSGFDPDRQKIYLINSGVNLKGMDLTGRDLSDSDLSNADLSDANLNKANLRGTDLSNANLSDANLSNADLRNTKGITVSQLKAAKNWSQAIYNHSWRQELGLSPTVVETSTEAKN